MSLDIHCDRCGDPLTQPGALIFSPPQRRTVEKYHLCVGCYEVVWLDCAPLVDATQKAASMMGKRGGLKGGAARAAALSPKRRSEIARRAAKIRWAKSNPKVLVS